MRAFLNYHMEVVICMGIFYLFYYLLLRKETDHQFVRIYLLSALVVSFLIPLTDFQLIASPLEQVNPIIYLEEFLFTDNPDQTVITDPADSMWGWYLLYWIVSGCLLMKLVWEFTKLYQLSRKHITGGIESYKGCKVVLHDGGLPTFSFMKTIYLATSDLQPEEAKLKILAHEQSHIAGAHSYDRLLVELARITCWFNPMIYLYKHALTLSHEYIADKESVNDGEQQQYVNLLVNQTLSNLGLSLGSHFGRKSGILSEWPLSFNKSQTLKRIKMIKNKRKSSKLKYIIPVLAVVISVVVISCMEDEAIEAAQPEIENSANTVIAGEPEVIEGPIFTVVENKPEYPGGDAEMYKHLGTSINYPQTARDAGIEGRVFVQFIVKDNGELADVKVVKGVDPALDAEALRVISEMPAWNPGQQRGINVNVRMVLPVFFKLAGSEGTANFKKKTKDDIEQQIEVQKAKAEKELGGNVKFEETIVVGHPN